MNLHVLAAVFRRNLIGYFASPTGYLFICLFVLLCSLAAFFPPDFFNNNLANLDQLSWGLAFLGVKVGFPLIMLVFIPTITMGIWADERKQGTDELLLTIPAGDFDIVLGKYLAAAAIFTISLLFSMVCNFAVLRWLGKPDVGLFAATYVGYWLVGLAMLSVGLVASFLTGNLTIAYILGALFNLPLVMASAADLFLMPAAADAIKQWGLAKAFDDFGHGVLSLSGAAYFLAVIVVMLYLSMVLIGRRHWFSGGERHLLAWHYVVRALALAAAVGGVLVVVRHHDLRWDATSEKLSSLAPQTRQLLGELDPPRPVVVDAFISPTVPESYVQTRLNLLSTLRELEALGGDKVRVHIHDTERFSDEAAAAAKRFGIEPRQIDTLNRGAISRDYVFLHVAVRCGTRKLPPVFIDRGVPIEYELVRSICGLAQQKKQKLGVLTTDAQLYGGFNMQTMSANPNWPIIDELEKQYELVRIDPTKPITEDFDALLAVQPSSLGPEEMENFIAAVRSGRPTAIFEDPAPVFCPGVPATSAPRQPGGMNPMMMRPQMPKGDISPLWRMLGVDFPADQIVWQDYNPYPKFSQFPKEFVFVDSGCGNPRPFNPKDPISADLQQVLFPFPGHLSKMNTSEMEFIPLIKTGEETGTVLYRDLMQMTPFGPRGGLNPDRRQMPTGTSYVLAARVRGKLKLDPPAEENDKKDKSEKKKPREVPLNVVLTSDIDMLSADFFRLREQGEVPELGVHFRFDNVTFVLNAIDEVVGGPQAQAFIDIRKRRPAHRTLTRVEDSTKQARQKAADERQRFTEEYDKLEEQEEKQMQEKLAELQNRKDVDLRQMATELGMLKLDLERRKQAKLEQARREKDSKISRIETDLNLTVKQVQNQYKLWAVLLPPILPLVLAWIVFFNRRIREREGVAGARLRRS
jgi:ABC-2 type transport system permease protein